MVYDKNTQSRIAEEFADEAMRRLEGVSDWSNATLSADQYAHILHAFDNAALLAAFMKDASFEEEKEWRIVKAEPISDDLAFRTSRGIIVPYAKLTIDEVDRRHLQIVIGPGPHPHLLEEAIALSLNRLAKPGQKRGALGITPGISHSQIPYRNW